MSLGWDNARDHGEYPYIIADVDHDSGSLRDRPSPILVLSGAAVWYAERRDVVPAERLFDHCIDVRQRRTIGELRQSIRPDDDVKLLPCALLNLWVEEYRAEKSQERPDSLEGEVNASAPFADSERG